MYLYILNYWVGFPSSEYGGLLNVIAKNDKNALKMLVDYDKLINAFNTTKPKDIKYYLDKGKKLKLADENVKPQILEAFIT